MIIKLVGFLIVTSRTWSTFVWCDSQTRLGRFWTNAPTAPNSFEQHVFEARFILFVTFKKTAKKRETKMSARPGSRAAQGTTLSIQYISKFVLLFFRNLVCFRLISRPHAVATSTKFHSRCSRNASNDECWNASTNFIISWPKYGYRHTLASTIFESIPAINPRFRSPAAAPLNTTVSLEARPVTQQGLEGMRLKTAGPGRQIADKSYFLSELRQKISELSKETKSMTEEVYRKSYLA